MQPATYTPTDHAKHESIPDMREVPFSELANDQRVDDVARRFAGDIDGSHYMRSRSFNSH